LVAETKTMTLEEGTPKRAGPRCRPARALCAERGLILLRTANLLTGSQQAAEDLLQAAL
jgi:hypothetical protein